MDFWEHTWAKNGNEQHQQSNLFIFNIFSSGSELYKLNTGKRVLSKERFLKCVFFLNSIKKEL